MEYVSTPLGVVIPSGGIISTDHVVRTVKVEIEGKLLETTLYVLEI